MRIIKLGLARALAATVAACQKSAGNVDGARIAAADAGSYRISSALRPPAHSPHVAHGKRPAAKGFLARLFGR